MHAVLLRPRIPVFQNPHKVRRDSGKFAESRGWQSDSYRDAQGGELVMDSNGGIYLCTKYVARLPGKKKERPMTMAPNRKKRGYWIEIIFISVLLFLLLGGRSQ